MVGFLQYSIQKLTINSGHQWYIELLSANETIIKEMFWSSKAETERFESLLYWVSHVFVFEYLRLHQK